MHEACTASLRKLDEYYTLATNQQKSHSTISTICDLRYNFNVFNIIWDKGSQTAKKNRAKAQWQECFYRYSAREAEIRVAKMINDDENQVNNEEATKVDTDSEDELYASQSNYHTKPEWKRWMQEPTLDRGTDILKYWQSKQFQYPTIARIAKDHLAILATSAESERVFSIGGDIVTKKRNRLAPSTLRYLLCLRNWGIISPGEDEDEDKLLEVENS